MASWPSTLPNLTMTDSIDTLNQVVTTEMEAGNEVSRRITTVEIDSASITLRFTDTEMLTFRQWFNRKDATYPDGWGGANGGAAWFTATVLTGYGMDITKDCKIVSPYKMKHVGLNWWDVSFTFKVRYA